MRLAALATLSLLAVPAAAAPKGECRLVDVAFQPTVRTDLAPPVNPAPQIVVWIEDASGVFVDTLFITKQTGSYGLGNRPGRFDFNSGHFARWLPAQDRSRRACELHVRARGGRCDPRVRAPACDGARGARTDRPLCANAVNVFRGCSAAARQQ